MTTVTHAAKLSRQKHRHVSRGLMLLPVFVLCAVVALAATYVSYILWPRWPGSAVAPDAPALPIMVGEVTFNIPPGAIRVPVQRKPGVQERVDLAFLWPSLIPWHSTKPPPASPATKPVDHIFVTITSANGALPPIERLKTIYPRYTAEEPEPTAAGMVALRFRDGTPYQGEDLIYEAANPERFFLRCTQDGPGHIPGTCLAERRLRNADLIIRFPRDWIADWRGVAGGIDRLVASLNPH